MLNVVICDDSTRDASQLEQYLLSYDKVPVETKLYTNPQNAGTVNKGYSLCFWILICHKLLELTLLVKFGSSILLSPLFCD